jgi:hypothetical protein
MALTPQEQPAAPQPFKPQLTPLLQLLEHRLLVLVVVAAVAA